MMGDWEKGSLAVLAEVFRERGRQVERYGLNAENIDGTGPEVYWIPGLNADEAEDVFRQDYEATEARDGMPTWLQLVREEVAEAFCETDPERLRGELLQVAALCVSWVERLDDRAEVRS